MAGMVPGYADRSAVIRCPWMGFGACNDTALDWTDFRPPGIWRLAMEGIVRSWGRILSGYAPSLSIEITRECPLRCPGCYAFGDEHLGGGGITLRDVRDFKGQALIDGI